LTTVPLSRRPLLLAAAALIGIAAPAPAQTRLTGIDVSHWQGTITWSKVKGDGNSFVICKATEGGTNRTAPYGAYYKDPTFDANWAAIKANGMTRGAYHFGRPGRDPITQADFFVNTVRPTSGDLQLVLDLEVTDGKSAAQVWAWTQMFCSRVKTRTGRPPIIYCSPSFWTTNVGNPTNNMNCPLWIANWNVTSPTIPRAWGTWTFWQYSSTGTTNGISGIVDQDYFNGDQATLNKLTLP
jgi:lysozyme